MDEMDDVARIAARAGDAAEFLKSLASEPRLMILCALLQGERSVGTLVHGLGLSQPNVSQHLARLRVQGLVGARRTGTTIHYRLTDPTVEPIIAALHARFCRH